MKALLARSLRHKTYLIRYKSAWLKTERRLARSVVSSKAQLVRSLRRKVWSRKLQALQLKIGKKSA